ncbi:MAG: hypothetical protein V1933_01070 [Candidatus Omnitrophota bacterium]
MKIIILTEGGKNCGFGHLSRCIALAQGIKAVKPGIKANFIIKGDESAGEFLKLQNVVYVNLDWPKRPREAITLAEGADVIIIDSYIAPLSFYSRLAKIKSGPKPCIAALDDYNRMNYPVDIVVNPSMFGGRLNHWFTQETKPKYLLGGDYIILRREFWKVPRKPIKRKIEDVLVTFGGIERNNFIKRLMNFLSGNFPNLTYHIINGPRDFKPASNFKAYSGLTALKMRNLMLRCDVCLSAGGQTLYELARVGLPAIGICFAENQRLNLKSFADMGLIEYAGWFNESGIFDKLGGAIKKLSSREKRVKRSKAVRLSVDGLGVKRIAECLLAA